MKNICTLRCLIFSAATLITQSGITQTHVATITKYTNTSTATINQTFAASSISGNLIIVHLSWDNQARSVSSVKDNKGNTYIKINGPTNWHTNYRSELWYAYNITGGGAAIKITATLTGASTSYFQIYMSEYSGISTANPLDAKSVRSGSTATVNSGTASTSIAGELIYGVSIGSAGALTAGGTFAVRSSVNDNVVEDKIGTTAGSYSTAFTSAGGDWVAEMATFKPLIILPVDLLGFDAVVTSPNSVKLDWVTTSEINNSYFEVQHSRNGVDWTTSNKLKGAGSSNAPIHYSVTDSFPFPGLSYYRLMLFDLDGRTRSSEVRTVQIDLSSKKKIRLYPNPANNYLTVEEDSADPQTISVINYMGQMMNDKILMNKENDGKIILNLSFIPGGLYFLKTKDTCFPFYKQ